MQISVDVNDSILLCRTTKHLNRNELFFFVFKENISSSSCNIFAVYLKILTAVIGCVSLSHQVPSSCVRWFQNKNKTKINGSQLYKFIA